MVKVTKKAKSDNKKQRVDKEEQILSRNECGIIAYSTDTQEEILSVQYLHGKNRNTVNFPYEVCLMLLVEEGCILEHSNVQQFFVEERQSINAPIITVSYTPDAFFHLVKTSVVPKYGSSKPVVFHQAIGEEMVMSILLNHLNNPSNLNEGNYQDNYKGNRQPIITNQSAVDKWKANGAFSTSQRAPTSRSKITTTRLKKQKQAHEQAA